MGNKNKAPEPANKVESGSHPEKEPQAEKARLQDPESLSVTFDGNMWAVRDERDALRYACESRKEAAKWATGHCKNVAVYRKDGSVRE